MKLLFLYSECSQYSYRNLPRLLLTVSLHKPSLRNNTVYSIFTQIFSADCLQHRYTNILCRRILFTASLHEYSLQKNTVYSIFTRMFSAEDYGSLQEYSQRKIKVYSIVTQIFPAESSLFTASLHEYSLRKNHM